ncbi:MAG: N-acetylmuramoyl-L-alanine amidase [Nitrospirae bacterium]|nr:N-acetylmuramoyl-L-alanine amidase [Nitrospirota bacterium]
MIEERLKKIICIPVFLSALFLFLLLPSLSQAEPGAENSIDVTDISFWSYPHYTRIVVSLSGKTLFVKKHLANPDRLYFDIKNSHIKKELKTNLAIGNDMLRSVRASQFDENTVRVVLDLEKIKDYNVIHLEEPDRIVIDVYGSSAEVSTKKRIVIDAGHGGHDPGAVGPNRLFEKDIVLDIALKLKKILSADPGLEIYLTRETDVFLKLEERTAIANSKNADLFVSVHANASPRRDARGIETYLLNWTNDEEAMKVAARENQISLKKMKRMQGEMDVLGVILGDLKRDVKRDESIKLANYIQQMMINDLSKSYQNIVDHGVKQALFYVLFGAQMPSVLVEVSFISNPVEEKLLSKEKYRGSLAKSIASGIARYMSSSSDVQTVAGVRKSLDSRD